VRVRSGEALELTRIASQRTSVFALQMSALEGKADMTFRGANVADIPSCTAHVRFWGVKRTSLFAPHMSAYDPKRTSQFTAFMADNDGDVHLPVSERCLYPSSL